MLRPLRRHGCIGCLGALALGMVLSAGVYGLIAPWSFHIGGRWTPTAEWSGVGELRDSAGTRFGVLLVYSPYIRTGRRAVARPVSSGKPLPACPVRGRVLLCNQAGRRYEFEVSGESHGAWLRTDNSELELSLAEPGQAKPRRAFTLYGVWHGPELAMDDRKSMFIQFQPGGDLTPAVSYSSPFPDKFAKVTLRWGTPSDFDTLCAGLGPGPR